METKDIKLKYEIPVVLDLGEMAKGSGLFCSGGISATGSPETCTDGLTDVGSCMNGNTPNACGTGTGPTNDCMPTGTSGA